MGLGVGVGKIGECGQRYKLSVIKKISYGDVMYSIDYS